MILFPMTEYEKPRYLLTKQILLTLMSNRKTTPQTKELTTLGQK